MGTQLSSLAPDREWISFSARSDHLLDPETPLRDPEHITYPSKEDPSVIPVHIGHLERKKRYTRTYRESYFVLTPAGFLHEYSNSDITTYTSNATPIFSLFLPACTLGPPSTTGAKSHKFHIETTKEGSGTTKSGLSIRSTLRGKTGGHAYSFRSRSREDMMEWWNDIRMLCARYLVASEQMERSGPVAAAVRSAGYVSESEEEYEDEDGSSIEEEEDEVYDEAREEALPPSYSHNTEHAGYPVEKKPGANLPGHLDDDEAEPAVEGAGIVRKPSKRQQEKAPEGRPLPDEPSLHEDHNGHAHGENVPESRFKEEL